jgi:hypothetical protein
MADCLTITKPSRTRPQLFDRYRVDTLENPFGKPQKSSTGNGSRDLLDQSAILSQLHSPDMITTLVAQ